MKLAKHVYGFSDEHILLFIENELDQWLKKAGQATRRIWENGICGKFVL
jgi:hypothetical protein